MKKKNPMTFSYANLRRWLYLNIKPYKEPYNLYLKDILDRCVNYFFKTFDDKLAARQAIRPIIEYFIEEYLQIHSSFNKKRHIFENKSLWRQYILENPPKLRSILAKYMSTGILSLSHRDFLMNWWHTADRYAFDNIVTENTPTATENWYVRNPITFSYANLRRWLYLNIKPYRGPRATYINNFTEKCMHYFFRENIDFHTFSSKAIQPIIEYFVDKHIEIYRSDRNILQKNAMWRQELLDVPPKLQYILYKKIPLTNAPRGVATDTTKKAMLIFNIYNWWQQTDPIAYENN